MRIVGLMKTTLLDYPDKVASTIFTGGCNFRCPYCHNGDLVLDFANMEPYSEEEIFEHLNKRKNTLNGVCITGGEPTLQADLPEFIKKVKDLGLLVKLDSNGTNPDMIRKLLDDKLLDYIAMDIKHCKERYNEVACMKNYNIKPIEESVNIIMNSDIDYEFRTTVVSQFHEIQDIEKIGKWIAGAKRYFLQNFEDHGTCIQSGLSGVGTKTLEEMKETAKPYVKEIEIRGVKE